MNEDELRREEILAKAHRRAAELREAEHAASKGQAPTTSRRREVLPAPAASSPTEAWRDYFERRLERRDRSMMRAIAEVVIAEERARQAEVAELRERVMALELELRELRGRDIDRRLRAVPTPPSALIA